MRVNVRAKGHTIVRRVRPGIPVFLSPSHGHADDKKAAEGKKIAGDKEVTDDDEDDDKDRDRGVTALTQTRCRETMPTMEEMDKLIVEKIVVMKGIGSTPCFLSMHNGKCQELTKNRR